MNWDITYRALRCGVSWNCTNTWFAEALRVGHGDPDRIYLMLYGA
jgi:hypothetical protein